MSQLLCLCSSPSGAPSLLTFSLHFSRVDFWGEKGRFWGARSRAEPHAVGRRAMLKGKAVMLLSRHLCMGRGERGQPQWGCRSFVMGSRLELSLL